MSRKRREDKPAPVYFVPPARVKTRDKQIPSGVSGGAKAAGSGDYKGAGKTAPVYFERQHKLPELDRWSGWEEDMPPEYLVCPSCLAPRNEKHLKGCPRPDMKRIGWHCPACDTKPRSNHAAWCPRNKFDENPFTAAAYTDSIFLERVGFEKQIIFGHGHPTPMKSRIRIAIAAKRNEYTSEPWRLPTLSKQEQADCERISDTFADFPDDDLPF